MAMRGSCSNRTSCTGRCFGFFGTTLQSLLVPCGILFSFVSVIVHGQEKPSILIPAFSTNTSLVARQNVCDRFYAYDRGQVKLESALSGLQLRPALAAGDFFRLDETTGGIDEYYPGMIAVILDELASRAGFTWRDSFGVTYPPQGGNHTYSDLLVWSTDYYDLAADWWIHTLERLQMGASFPEGWYDASYVLVGKAEEVRDTDGEINLWLWLEPFTSGVWVLIVITIILSAFIYQFLDSVGNPCKQLGGSCAGTRNENGQSEGDDDDGPDYTVPDQVFLLSLLFTQHFQLNPRTPASRLFAVSMALWALIISANYTANLASYFVIENTPAVSIQSIDHAIQGGWAICVWGTSAQTTHIEKTYPKAELIRKKNEREMYHGVNDGECALAVSTADSFAQHEKEREVNPDCNLQIVGRVIRFSSAGFATKSDSGTFCKC